MITNDISTKWVLNASPGFLQSYLSLSISFSRDARLCSSPSWHDFSDAPSRVTSKLNTWSESSNKRTTLSGVAKFTLELPRFRWNVEFQEKIFKLEMESSILVKIRNSDGCNLCFIEYLCIYYAELDLYSLVMFTVDKAGKFLPSHTPSFNNLSRISLPNMLGFINLNNSMDSRTLSESLEGFLRPPQLRGKICAVRNLIRTNDATHSAISNTNCWWDFPRSLSAQINTNQLSVF